MSDPAPRCVRCHKHGSEWVLYWFGEGWLCHSCLAEEDEAYSDPTYQPEWETRMKDNR